MGFFEHCLSLCKVFALPLDLYFPFAEIHE